MDSHEVTWALMGLVTIVLIVWDIYVVVGNSTAHDSISSKMQVLGQCAVGVPLMWGVLGGHFWGDFSLDPLFGQPWSEIVLASSVLALTAMHHLLRRAREMPGWSALIYLAAGIPMGVLLWPL